MTQNHRFFRAPDAVYEFLRAQVDAAWNDVQAQIDPDNPANAGTPAGDDPAAA